MELKPDHGRVDERGYPTPGKGERGSQVDRRFHVVGKDLGRG